MSDPRRALPSIEAVLQTLRSNEVAQGIPHDVLAQCAREAVHDARMMLDTNREAKLDVHADAMHRVMQFSNGLLQPLVNATGILLHTNLGRAPLGQPTVAAMVAAAGSTNLEYRLDEGTRGSRHDHAGALFALACGAEDGMVVNNNAAAIVLVLATLARGREVIVSRGELVEIGGGFRVPEILAETGAQLVEVGTTNRTRVGDYERAITASTALTLKVHASNYRMVGFTETTPVAALAELSVPVVVDAGSGLLDATAPWLETTPRWLYDEPGIRQCVAAGASVVTMSGDKLLGGPQAGIIVGKRELIARMKQHPLARALRCDKTTIAGLQAVALAYLDRDVSSIPLWSMASATLESLEQRARAIIEVVGHGTVIETEAAAGGGALPGHTIPSRGIAVKHPNPTAALRSLRVEYGIVALSRDDSVVCDLRTVNETDDATLSAALRAIAEPAVEAERNR